MENVLILLLIVSGVLATFLLGLTIYFVNLKRRVDVFFQKGEENLEKTLLSQLKGLEEQEKDIKKIFEEISQLKEKSQKSFQKIGLIRFNPFKNVGSDQSFSIAMLDLNNDGFVITSIYDREGSQIYAKPVKSGKSKYSLSKEEKEVIEKAMG